MTMEPVTDQSPAPPRVHPTAIVHPAAQLGDGVEVGAYAIIGPNVQIGANTVIDPHVYIEAACKPNSR